MKETLTCHIIAFLSALVLSGCGMTSEANAVKDPTVDQMADLDKQWGLKPREMRQRAATNDDLSVNVPSPNQSSRPATDTVPLPDAPSAPVPEAPTRPPEVTPIPPSLR